MAATGETSAPAAELDSQILSDDKLPAERYMSRPLQQPSVCECGSGLLRTKLNPGVFFGSLTFIWGFIIWAGADSANARAKTSEWDAYIGNHFSWLYIGSVNIFLLMCLYLVFSKHGDIVLGKPGDKPKYSYASWFAMLFSAGIGIGLFFFGVGEPVFHYAYPTRYTHQFMTACSDPTVNRTLGIPGTSASCFTPESRDLRALNAMNISWYHWGFGASCCYVVVGLPIALYHYKYDQPLTMRTAMFPILGNRINGWFGDVVEVAATIGTCFGVCTSLGLGVTQIAGGLTRINNDIDNNALGTKIAIIWVITAIATVSVVTGLDVGIKRISEANFILGIFILGMLFFMGDIAYLMDFFVSEWGYHLYYWFSLSWASDGITKYMPIPENGAWSRNDTQVNGLINGGTGYDHVYQGTQLPSWMTNWTIFYWAWWISWSPFVGLFIARISGGRTIREFILGNMFVPTLLTCVWLLIFGGRGLYYEMWALDEGWTCTKCEALDGYVAGKIGCPLLSCRAWAMDKMLFDMLEQMPLTDFMTILTTLGISLYFVTSSDSASAVIDQIASNGETDGPVWQRMFWAITEGLTATVVLASAGDDAKAAEASLKALRSISIISALPFCLIMLLAAFGFMRFLSVTSNPQRMAELKTKKDFNINVFDSCFRVVFNTLTLGLLGNATGDKICNTVQALFFPALLQLRNAQLLGYNLFGWGVALIVPNACMWLFSILAGWDVEGAAALYGISWLTMFCVGVVLRLKIREKLNIEGTFAGDLCSWMWCGPYAAYQEFMALHENQITPWGKEYKMNPGQKVAVQGDDYGDQDL